MLCCDLGISHESAGDHAWLKFMARNKLPSSPGPKRGCCPYDNLYAACMSMFFYPFVCFRSQSIQQFRLMALDSLGNYV